MRLSGSSVLPALAGALLLAGLGLLTAGRAEAAHLVWTLGLYAGGIPVVLGTAAGALRGVFRADLVASLAIVAAMALAQPFAGLVIVLMQTGGEALERGAERRATRAVRELEALAPRVAHRRTPRGLEDVPVEAVKAGEVLVVRPGEMVPCDGVVREGSAAVDVARITGEPVPLAGRAGVVLRSGSVVLDGPLVVEVTAPARESLYARIVELVRTAQAGKAPLQRVADRIAVWFTPLTLAVCAGAWAASGDPTRILAVLVVATPCPLILATPVAILGGINRAARRRIIVRHGGALEALAAVDTVVLDKTGTVTLGRPEVHRLDPVPPWSGVEVLAAAAAVEQGAGHPLARSVVRAAEAAALPLETADGVTETAGRGVTGRVAGRRVTIGSLSLLRELEPAAAGALARVRGAEDGLQAFVALDGAAAGVVTFADRPRPEGAQVLRALRDLGLERQVLLSGDDTRTVRAVSAALGVAEAIGDLLPEDKVARVRDLQREGRRVLMVGDGINDAPALGAATVGLALAEHGGGIAAESADVVVLEDNLTRVADAVVIARRTMRVARQSLAVGLGFTLVAMLVAAGGAIPPAAGALLQEAIDLAVIGNALRAARDPAQRLGRLGGRAARRRAERRDGGAVRIR